MPKHTQAIDELLAIFASAKIEEAQRAPLITAAIPAARRLAAFVVEKQNLSDQSEIILRALASIYNGSEAKPVRLDELRWLEWPHQRDLLAVIFGTGAVETPDTHIREAFELAGGAQAVALLHSRLDK